jgi:hypothetical protein
MVGHAATGLLVGDSDQDRTNARLEMRGDANNAIAAASSCRQGLEAKKSKTSLRRVKCFYLTSSFIEPAFLARADHDEWATAIACIAVRQLSES